MNNDSKNNLFNEGKCKLSDEWSINDMKVIWMENDFLKIGILAGRGSDIFEFRYKPLNLDFMLRLKKGIKNPQKDFSQMRHTPNQFEDYYYGGWQEILPNSPGFNYRGAELGQHGEVSLIPWKYSILTDTPEKISVKFWTSPLRVPIKIEKTLTMVFDKAELFIEEKLTNESKTDLDIIWGQHIAFGLPFLKDGGKIETNAKKIISEVAMPPARRFKPGIETDYPNCININGDKDDASIIPPATDTPYSELSYLSNFDGGGEYTIFNSGKNIGFNLKWDSKLFKYLWLWQERYSTENSPWWGDAYAIALEPWTSMWKADAEKAIENGEWVKLKKNEPILTSLTASVLTK